MINCLDRAKEDGCESISIPNFTFGFKSTDQKAKDEIAYTMQNFAAKWAAQEDTGSIKTITFCVKNAGLFYTFRHQFKKIYR